ncbi:MAG TPA: gamma carbonic anhydrase family protein [Xanthobacteraceae bacterium]|nr:gamma carbonic anhydrase family protein [Xanthobacteraceae bacterium]
MTIYELDGIAPKLPASGRFWIAPSAVLIGNVQLEDEASVWFGAVLRGDNERILIGKRSNVQDGSVFHTDPGFPLTLGEACTIGHRAILHGCTIGDGALVGMGAIVLNGAKIGARSIVGAGALVTEGKEFPPQSLIVGAPARAIRTLDEKGVQMARFGAEAYFMRWQQYAKGLQEVR